jgi:DNA modification methylase
VSRPGDLWVLGRHRLLQADARDPASYERLMLSGEQARLVLTDEPYNVSIGAETDPRIGVQEGPLGL